MATDLAEAGDKGEQVMDTFTNDERREVAARLRKTRGIMAFVDALGIDPDGDWCWTDVSRRVAELIDPPEITEDTSDGYHTFGQLYYQRMALFAVLVQEHKDCAWKTWNHEDGESCFGGGWFLVTIDTPRGAYGYHFEEKYWRLFDCTELPKAKHWDGYTEENVNRLFSLNCYEVSGDAE